jgi:UDP-N-acetylmuramoyl-tripeptide--D-alanyl-D-alanine ligase
MTLADAAYACGGELHIRNCLRDIDGHNCDYVPRDENTAGKNGRKPGDGRLYKVGTDVISDTEFLGGVTDSRRIQPGCLFFAVGGQRVDGHSFVASAYQKGALCCVVSKTPEEVETTYGISRESWGAYILVGDVLQALKDIAEAYRLTLSIPVIGVTGSVGKTSTKEWIASVLAEKYVCLKTEGNFNNEIGLPLTLLRIQGEHQVAVVEMGISDFGEMTRLSKIARPDICVITNIGQCHLENLKDRDGVLQAKSEIFTYMNPEGWVCLSGEDDKLRTISEVHGKKTLFFGIEAGDGVEKAVYLTDKKSKGLLGSSALLHIRTAAGEETTVVELPLPGEHMLLNAAAAACVAHLLGLTLEQIRSGLAKAESVGGRSHLLSLANYTVIDDCYNANPVSMKAALDLLMLADTPKSAVLGDMFELGEDSSSMHREVGAYAAGQNIQRLYFIGEQAKEMYLGAKRQLEGSAAAVINHTESNSGVLIEQTNEGSCGTINQRKVDPSVATYQIGTRKLSWYPTKEAFTQNWFNGEKTACLGYTILLKASHGMGFSDLMKSMFSDSENKSLQ